MQLKMGTCFEKLYVKVMNGIMKIILGNVLKYFIALLSLKS